MNIEQIRAAAERQSLNPSDSSCVKIYVGSSAADSNAARIAGLFQSAIDESNLRAKVVRTGSFGFYDLEPIVIIDNPDLPAVLYNNVAPGAVNDFAEDAIIKGTLRKDGALCSIGSRRANGIPHLFELPLFKLQNRIALRNCGWIDPEDINDYIIRGQGYTGLSRALKMSRSDLTGMLIPSALKGRGFPGCSTADKWMLFCGTGIGEKYLICNAVDPDPGSLASRLLLEGDPHSVLEGVLISAYAVGASHCFIFMEEKTEAVKRLRKALDQMKTYNLLGRNILESEFCSGIEIKEAPALWLSGYGTELFRCAEEREPLPHMLPSYPGAAEFAGKPVLIVNPEILSDISAVLRSGMKDVSGTKVVTLSGRAVRKYTVEVSFGTTIRSIIDSFGAGVSDGKVIKAARLGGPAGVFVAPDALDLSVDCEAAEESYSNISPGTIDVLDVDCSIVDTTRDIMTYIQAQSCGKCVFCREGCLQMLTILEDISENKSRSRDLDLLVEIGEEMRTACLCDFGRAAPGPVLSGIKLFRAEYENRGTPPWK